MDFALTPEQERIREAVQKICEKFDDAYWLKKDREGGFPATFTRRLPRPAGWAFASHKNTEALGWA